MRLPNDTQSAKFVSTGPAESTLDDETHEPVLDETGAPPFVPGCGAKNSPTVMAPARSVGS